MPDAKRIQHFRDLDVYSRSFDAAMKIFEITKTFPSEERYGIVAQVRRASVSVVSNIAEGQGRRSRGEFKHFLEIALGSLAELETQVLISNALGYAGSKHSSELLEIAAEVGRLINGLIKSIRYDRLPD